MKKKASKAKWYVILLILAALALLIGYVKFKPVWAIKKYLKSNYSMSYEIEYVSGSFCDDTTTYRVTPQDGQRCFYLTLRGRSRVISDTFLLAQLSDELVNMYSEELAAIWGSCTVYLSLESVPLSKVPLMDVAGMSLIEQLAYTNKLYQTIYIQPDTGYNRRLAEQKYYQTVEALRELNQEMQYLGREWLEPVICFSEPDGSVILRESVSDALAWTAAYAWLEERFQEEGIYIDPEDGAADEQ